MSLIARSLFCAGLSTVVLAHAPAHAGEVYANAGLPGLGLGYAHALNSSFTLRGEYSTLGNHRKNVTEEGVNYTATAKLNRAGLFADWFIWGGLRLTGGVTFNDAKATLLAQGNGQQMTIGNYTFVTSPDDRLQVDIRFPRTTPYLGFGYGHQLSSGWGFLFDIGASYGRAKLTETHSGTNMSNVPQADIDRELAELREGVGKAKYIPQVSFGVALRF